MKCGDYDTIEEVKQRIRELADENFRRDGGEYDRIWDECAAAHPEVEPEGFVEPERACREFCDRCADSFGFEWRDDLKWVRIREMVENAAGNRTFVKVL